MKPHSRAPTGLVLSAGILAVSSAAVLIRLAEAPPLVIAAYRLGLASLVLLPVELALSRRMPRPGDLGRCALSGFFLAVHFAAWISSLSYTSVASSVALVTVNPIFVGLFSRWVLKEPVSRRTAAGIAVSVAGALIVGWGDFRSGPAPLLGDALALLGALAASGYLLSGRVARRSLGIRTYSAWTYAVAAVLLAAAAAAAGLPFRPYPAATYAALVLLALVPQVVGHTALNWALGHLSAAAVAVVILGEPIGATLLAFFVLGERPGASVLVGGALILAGIALALGPAPGRSVDAT